MLTYLLLFLASAITLFTPINALAYVSHLGSSEGNVQMAVAAVPVELFTGELIKKFRFFGTWADQIPSQNDYANNNVIHLVKVGVDPTVLINNTSYPIATAQRSDEDVAVALKKFDTTNTVVTDDELYAITYDKIASAANQHQLVLKEQTQAYGLYNLSVAGNSATTPVLETTGPVNPATGQLSLTLKDVANFKQKLDLLKVPKIGRMLILHPIHATELLNDTTASNVFRDLYADVQQGKIVNFYGFEIYEDVYAPIYDASGAKKAWGAAPAANDRPGSVHIFKPRAFKAMGDLNFYYRPAYLDPENRQNTMGYRLWHIMLPKLNTGFGAIISGLD